MKLACGSKWLLWAALPALALAAIPAAAVARVQGRDSEALHRSLINLGAFRVHPGFSFDTGSGLTQSAPRGVDLDCSVVTWDTSDDKPVLTLDCPAQKRPTPFRVYIRLSWMGSSDRPSNYRKILAPPKTAAKFHSDARGAYVWLRLQDPCRGRAHENWIKFSELVSLEMVREPAGSAKACSRKEDHLDEEINR